MIILEIIKQLKERHDCEIILLCLGPRQDLYPEFDRPAVIFLAVSGQTGAAIGVGLWCAIVVGTLDNVLTPKLIGKDTEMPDLLVLLTTLGGLAIFGIVGIIIGPVVGALFVAVWQLWGNAIDETHATLLIDETHEIIS
ncbi:hypothetical protein BH11VER1_BH11VER1_33990 [soil metagenome]